MVRFAPKGDLREGDILRAINTTPIRDLNELARVLGEFDPGTEVELNIKRGKSELFLRVRLVPPSLVPPDSVP